VIRGALGVYLLLVWILSEPFAWGGKDPCSIAFTKRKLNQKSASAIFLKDFWKNTSGLLLEGKLPNGKTVQLPVTYSIDSEIDAAEVLRLVDPNGPYAKQIPPDDFDTIKKNINVIIPPRSTRDWAIDLRVSEKQFQKLVLKTGVAPNLEEYGALDIKPGYLRGGASWMLSMPAKDTFKYHTNLAEKLIVGLDGSMLELRHKSFDSTPAEYHQTNLDFHKLFPGAQTHFHIGIPAIVMGYSEPLAVAQILETRIILKLIEAFRMQELKNLKLKLPYHNPGPLLRAERNRGIIQYSSGEFNTNSQRYHDLEIRQHDSFQDGLAQVAYGSYLLSHHQRLRVVPEKGYGNGRDPSDYLGNVFGAAEFLLEHMKNQTHWNQARLGLEGLVKLKEKNVDVHEFALKIQEWMHRWQVLEGLDDPEFFLNPETSK
jgi:hypothetical protein